MDRTEPQTLLSRISEAVEDLERSGDIVICSDIPSCVTHKLYQVFRSELLDAPLSGQELRGLGELLREVLYGGNLSTSELVARTGLTQQQFETILKKLPHE